MNFYNSITIALLLLTPLTSSASELKKSDRVREQLIGKVQKVHVEISKISDVSGKWVPGIPMPWLDTLYNPAGQRIEEVQIYTNTALDFTSIFTHDSRGFLTEGVEYEAEGDVAFRWTYHYDKSEREITESRHHPNQQHFSTTTYLYDLEGNFVEENRFPPHGDNHFRWRYRYDKRGRMIEESHYLVHSGRTGKEGRTSLNSKLVFEYAQGLEPVKVIQTNGQGQTVSVKRYEYTFDAQGNWLSQTSFESASSPGVGPEIPTEVTVRQLTYHNK